MSSCTHGNHSFLYTYRVNNDKQWIQVDFLAPYQFAGIVTQGRADMKQWVTKYEVYYSNDGIKFKSITGSDGTPQVYNANADKNTPVTNIFPIHEARFIRSVSLNITINNLNLLRNMNFTFTTKYINEYIL